MADDEIDLRRWRDKQLGVPQVEQRDEHDCGPAVVEAVMRYWGGSAVNKDALEKALGTTRKAGTGPGALVDGLRAAGLEARSKQGCTVSELGYELGRGTTTILDIQAWSGKGSTDWAKETAHGHYVVLVGMDEAQLHFMDPSVAGKRASLPSGELMARWHDVEAGGERTNCLAIFARGHGEPKGSERQPTADPKPME